MKIITASNGKKSLKISKKDWESIGKKAGWSNRYSSDQPGKLKDCNRCHGSGSVSEKIRNPGTNEYTNHTVKCDQCNGKGYITQEDRDSCNHSLSPGTPCPFGNDRKSSDKSSSGKNALVKVAQDIPVQSTLIALISGLLQKEESYKQHRGDIPEMEERTPEDGAVGAGMSGRDFVEGLQTPFINILYDGQGEFKVEFNGNYEPSSVNAGSQKRLTVGYYRKEDVLALYEDIKSGKISCEIYFGEQAKRALGFIH